MRRLSLVIAILMVMALLVPSVIQAQTTSVTIQTGGGTIPLVKCKWEQQPVVDVTELEDGDTSHNVPGFQILPPVVACATKVIEYYAVVTDEEDGGNLKQVFADVYHPVGSPEPYGPGTHGGVLDLPYFKYEVPFVDLQPGITKVQAAQIVQYAYDRDLITFATSLSDVLFELDKGTAHLWMGWAYIDYEQPAGIYDVYAFAVDSNSNLSLFLHNQFEYLAVAGIEVDFNQIDFGSVALGTEKMIPGDTIWNHQPGVNGATVRNVGNTFASVEIQFSDMGFSKDVYGNWNVLFDARMGSDPAYYVGAIEPGVWTTLVNALNLSCKDELDLSINVLKGFGSHSGTVALRAVERGFTYAPIVGTHSVYPDDCP